MLSSRALKRSKMGKEYMPTNCSARSKKFSTRTVWMTEASRNSVHFKFGRKTSDTTQGSISTKCTWKFTTNTRLQAKVALYKGAAKDHKPWDRHRELLIHRTSEHPLLSASIPTEPVPLYKSNQRPGLKDAGQPPAALVLNKCYKKQNISKKEITRTRSKPVSIINNWTTVHTI